MARAIYQSYTLTYVLVTRTQHHERLRPSVFDFAAQSDSEAIRLAKEQFTSAIVGKEYYWITRLTETTRGTLRDIPIPKNIEQRRLSETTSIPHYAA